MMLAIAGLHGCTREQYSKGALRAGPGVLEFFADPDHAVEWCENRPNVGWFFVSSARIAYELFQGKACGDTLIFGNQNLTEKPLTRPWERRIDYWMDEVQR